MRFGGLRFLGLGLILGTLPWMARPKASHPVPGGNVGRPERPVPGAAPTPRSDEPRGYLTVVVVLGLSLAVTLGGYGWHAARQQQQARDTAVALTGGVPEHAPIWLARYGCGGCHTIPGVPGADGKVGPSLADLRERVYVGGVAANTPANLIGWIVDPQRFSPRSAMPATGISEAEARDVAAYLYMH